MDQADFKAAANFAFEGFSARASEWWLAALGGLVGWIILWLSGLQMIFDSVLPSNALVANTIVLVTCVVVGELIMLALRFAYFPIHRRAKPHGGIVQLARSRLGNLMAPIALIVLSFLSFITLFSGGMLWLVLRLPGDIANKTSAVTTHGETQPDLAASVPDKRMSLRWDIAEAAEIKLRYSGEEGETFSYPYFTVNSENNIDVADITVRWRVEVSDIMDIVHSSTMLLPENTESRQGRLIIKGNNFKQGYAYRVGPSDTEYRIPFITKTSKIAMPLSIYDITCLYLLAVMPRDVGSKSVPITYSVFLHWNIPKGGKDQEFKLTAWVTNNKAVAAKGVASGAVDFDVSRIR